MLFSPDYFLYLSGVSYLLNNSVFVCLLGKGCIIPTVHFKGCLVATNLHGVRNQIFYIDFFFSTWNKSYLGFGAHGVYISNIKAWKFCFVNSTVVFSSSAFFQMVCFCQIFHISKFFPSAFPSLSFYCIEFNSSSRKSFHWSSSYF